MVITVNCPSCSTSFPVDTNKVPVGGVRARCAICADVFRVERPEEQIPPPLPLMEPDAGDPYQADPGAEADSPVGTEAPDASEGDGAWVLERTEDIDPDALSIESVDTVETSMAEARAEEPDAEGYEAPDLVDPMAMTSGPAAEPFATPAWEPEAEAEPEPEPEPAPAAETPAVEGFSFGKRDPKDKARRLARVLVSDMISYNSERHERALANGTLKADFEEEIEKSWKEYVEQVGEEMAKGHPFWAEALNDVLAKGEQIF